MGRGLYEPNMRLPGPRATDKRVLEALSMFRDITLVTIGPGLSVQ